MALYEYECCICANSGTNEPYEFTTNIPMKDRHVMPKCPKCGLDTQVKKVIRTAVPKSQSWRA